MSGEESIQRTKKAKKNVVLMFLIKGMTMGISFLYVPLLLHTFKTTDYAVWLTLTSIVAWIAMFDVGLGNGLRNRLSASLAIKDYTTSRELVSTAYCCIFVFVVILCAFFGCIYKFISWETVLNAEDGGISNLDSLVLIVFISFCAQFALGLLNSILFALQMPALSSIILMIGQLLSFVIVYILSKFYGVVSLYALGSIISIIPAIVLLISSWILFNTHYKFLSPSLKLYRKDLIRDIFSVGIKFFLLQIITIVLFQANNLLITHIVGNTAVVEYNISYKYMHILSMLFSIIVTPIWSATTEAFTLGDFDWIKRINSRLIKIGLLFTGMGLLMLAISPYAYSVWLGKTDFTIDYSVSGILLIQSVFFIFYCCYGYILNGIGKLKAQMVFTSVLAVCYVPMAILLGKIWGLHGILIVFALSSVFNFTWSKIQYNKLMEGTAHGIWNK